MGKLTDAFKKLEVGHKAFNGDVDHWQKETKLYFMGVQKYQSELSKLMKIDDQILDQIKDSKAKSLKATELAHARGQKLKSIDPSMTVASEAQKKAFANCDIFQKLVEECSGVLKNYDTKGKPTKIQKQENAKKMLLQAKLDLAEIKKEKINYEYQGDGKAQWPDVKKAIEKVESLKKKLEELMKKTKAEIVLVEDK